MKRYAVIAGSLAACLLLTLACASSTNKTPGKMAKPDIQFGQLVGPAELGYPRGTFDVQFGMRVTNKAQEKLIVRSIELQNVGVGGPYAVRTETYFFNKEVAPDQYIDLAFWAHAYGVGNPFAVDATAPVTIRAVVYFDSPAGPFRQVFVKNLQQSLTVR
ncbi:MAG TPA: hypothetical protein VFN10_11845 [Thermoanaerobaculia bacterium]|nr:hypothetical protein [Thermoanaerobaculia bacterium]